MHFALLPKLRKKAKIMQKFPPKRPRRNFSALFFVLLSFLLGVSFFSCFFRASFVLLSFPSRRFLYRLPERAGKTEEIRPFQPVPTILTYYTR